jgi:hypothetical protein
MSFRFLEQDGCQALQEGHDDPYIAYLVIKVLNGTINIVNYE